MVRMTRSENGMYFGDEHDEKENALLTPLNGKAMGFELLHLLPVKVSRQVDPRFSRNFCGGCTLAMIKAKAYWSEIISGRASQLTYFVEKDEKCAGSKVTFWRLGNIRVFSEQIKKNFRIR